MVARHVARTAAPLKAIARAWIQGKRDSRGVDRESELVLLELDLRDDIDVVLAAGGDELAAAVAQKPGRLGEGQARQRVEERQLGSRICGHEIFEELFVELSGLTDGGAMPAMVRMQSFSQSGRVTINGRDAVGTCRCPPNRPS